jgi:ribosomal protein S18 acetylase RimI-like enzyme
MYVAPHVRRRGVGAALLGALIGHARSLPGLEWLQLGVGVHNEEARALYQTHGFRPWGIDRDALRVDGRSVDELRMRLRLDPAKEDVSKEDESRARRKLDGKEGDRPRR